MTAPVVGGAENLPPRLEPDRAGDRAPLRGGNPTIPWVGSRAPVR